ncbi:MAG: 30S ribosomal protein S8, partial [Elusimicrobia bacterium]|nr:30S ribosomal protein S8 [Elusimicrobiota bacterium]
MDPIADFLTRIRNGSLKGKEKVDAPFSKIKFEIGRVLKEEGYIANIKVVHNENKRGVVRVFLKYTADKEAVISDIKRVSKPSCRVYSSCGKTPKIRGAFGASIL